MLFRAIESINFQTVKPAVTYILLHETPENMLPVEHLCWQMNKGLRMVETPWLMRLADDDWLEPDHLEKMWKVIQEEPDHTLYYSYDKDGSVPRFDSSLYGPQELLELLFKKNWIDGTATIINTEALRSVGGFQYINKPFEDWDTWFAMARMKDFSTICLPEETWHAGRGNYPRIGGIH